ncbi:unnamed protein product [Cuscuta epithymum]|uniref:Ribosomal protein L32 n=1 Tax=Cuscuta epithymum TaxID=186058 RepID=A0AAV0G7B1_9ASTE|nr:unnamed protein product [Cuscuta epithymum]
MTGLVEGLQICIGKCNLAEWFFFSKDELEFKTFLFFT